MTFRIETTRQSWERKYPLYAKQKREQTKKFCLHLPKYHQDVTKVQGEMTISVTGCSNCGKILDPNEIRQAREYAAKFPKPRKS